MNGSAGILEQAAALTLGARKSSASAGEAERQAAARIIRIIKGKLLFLRGQTYQKYGFSPSHKRKALYIVESVRFAIYLFQDPAIYGGSHEVIVEKSKKRLSDILVDLDVKTKSDTISIGDMIDGLGTQAHGVLIFLFGVLNVFPSPPGSSAITGIPLIVLTWRLAMGSPARLPAKIRGKSFKKSAFSVFLAKVLPAIRSIEKLLRPRFESLADPSISRLTGWILLFLSILIFLPIPLANMMPAISISMIALGMMERDGLMVLFGALWGSMSVGVVVALYWKIASLSLGLL